MYKLPHIWQKVASLVQQKADPGGATDSLAQLVPELLARVQALESLLGDRPSGGVPMSVLQSIDSLQAGMQVRYAHGYLHSYTHTSSQPDVPG